MKITGDTKVSLHLMEMDRQDVNNLHYALLNILESRLSEDEKAVLSQLSKAVGKCVNTLNQENGVHLLK